VATAEPTVREVSAAGKALSLEVEVFRASASAEIDAAFDAMSRWQASALLVGSDPLFIASRAQLVGTPRSAGDLLPAR
jgi:hypothetical protein